MTRFPCLMSFRVHFPYRTLGPPNLLPYTASMPMAIRQPVIASILDRRMDNAIQPERLARIDEALKVFLVQERFTLSEMKERLPGEKPGYVTRMVHQLERDGHLRRDDNVYFWTCE